MCFFDLNIPYQESDRKVTDKSSLMSRRLKIVVKAMELGYTGVAYNRTVKGIMSEHDRCSVTLFPISKITQSSAFFSTVKFHRELLNVPVSRPFRQYSRITVVVDTPSQASALNSGNAIIKSYDIVAVRPMNQSVFDQACQTLEVNVISIDFGEKLPFRLKHPMIKAAMMRGVFFEISYTSMLADAQSRRQLVSNCKLLVDWTRGRSLIFSSAATSLLELRGPLDVANLFSVIGISTQCAQAAVSKNCRFLLENALRKKKFYKEAIKVEKIPVNMNINPDKSLYETWLKWDSISSDGGDILLDELEKSFVDCNNLAKPVKPITSNSYMNGLPANGLRIEKDVLCVTSEAPGSQSIINCPVTAIEIDAVVKTCENHADNIQSPGKQNQHENQGDISIMTTKSDEVICLTDYQSLDADIKSLTPISDEIEPTSMEQGDYPLISEQTNLPLNHGSENLTVDGGSVLDMPESGVSCFGVSENLSPNCKAGDAMPDYLASNVEDSAMLSISEKTEIPSEKMSFSCSLERNSVVRETEVQNTTSQVYGSGSEQCCNTTVETNSESQFEIEKCKPECLIAAEHEVTYERSRDEGSLSSSPCTQDLSLEKGDKITINEALSMRPLSVASDNKLPIFSVLNEDPHPDSTITHARLVKCRSRIASGNEKPLMEAGTGDTQTDFAKSRSGIASGNEKPSMEADVGKCRSGRGKRRHHSSSQPVFLFPFKRYLHSAPLIKRSRN